MAGTVTVACKMPNGLQLRVFKMVDGIEPILGGGHRTIQRAEQVGGAVKVNGPVVPYGQVPKHTIVGGYALTPGVDADFWAAWYEQNKSTELVKNKIIFGSEQEDKIKRHAEAHAKVKSGLEPIDPENPPQGMRGIKPADEMKDRL